MGRPDVSGGGQDRRRYPRTPLHRSGTLLIGGRVQDCTILDISPGGAKLESERAVQPTSVATLRLYHGSQFPGTIVWRDGDFMGMRFDTESERPPPA